MEMAVILSILGGSIAQTSHARSIARSCHTPRTGRETSLVLLLFCNTISKQRRGSLKLFRMVIRRTKLYLFCPPMSQQKKRLKRQPAKPSQTSSLLEATDSASTPRDRTQIYNMRKQSKEKEREEKGIPGLQARKDYSLMLMANQELDNDGESFIHGISAWPEAMCIVGLPYQFHDITRFCCGPLEFYPLCIDTTFNLGQFYVTPTTYKKLLLVMESHQSLSGLVCMTRRYSAYCHLASKLKEVEPGVSDLRASVTDGEPGLMKAWKVFYPESYQLRCVIKSLSFWKGLQRSRRHFDRHRM